MSELDGTYYDGRSSAAHRVRLQAIDSQSLLVTTEGWERCDALAQISLSPRLAGTHRTLRYADGASIELDDHALLDDWFPAPDPLERWVDRLERRWRAAAVAVLVVIAAGWFTFVVGVPWAAQRVAAAIPLSVERVIGDQVSDMLGHLGFGPTQLAATRRDSIASRYQSFAATIPGAQEYRLTFQAASLGANAFALPGGDIVLTDELVELLNDEQVLAVLAHETGHQQRRHVMRSVLQDSAVILIAAFFSGDVSSASAVVVAIPTFLMRSHYSRGFENEADEFAFAALENVRISPRRFAEAMEKLEQQQELDATKRARDKDEKPADYLSSHPASSLRIARALQRAAIFEAVAPAH